MNYLVAALLILFVICLIVVLYIIKHRSPVPEVRVNSFDKLAICQVNASFDTDQCDKMSKPFKDIIDSDEVTFTDNFTDANLILFTDYSLIDQNYDRLPFQSNKVYYVYGISGSDEMANKAALALNIRKKGYEHYIPKTYVLYDTMDMKLFAKEKKNIEIYILKKNIFP